MALLKRKTKEEKVDAVVEKTESKKPATKQAKDKKGISENASRILLRPIVTEKVAKFSDRNVLAFEVSVGAGKVAVKQAFKELYGITPKKVNTVIMPRQSVRFGRSQGARKAQKKAIITLPKNVKVDIFEGI